MKRRYVEFCIFRDGIKLTEIKSLLLNKIEELTLYVIESEKKMNKIFSDEY